MKTMLKIFFCFLFLSLSSLFGEEVIASSNSATTYSYIGFKDSSPNVPVNPINPDIPINNSPNKSDGELNLVVAPEKFNFGSQKKYHERHVYSARGNSKQYLQVNDSRKYNHRGWQVSVKQDHELIDNKNDNKLKGATLTIPKGKTYYSFDSNKLKVNSYRSLITTNSSSVVFSSSMNVNKKSIITDVWDPNNVKLIIPKGSAKSGYFSNNVEWTLTSGA